MNYVETVGMICVKEYNIEYQICKVIYTLYEDDKFSYKFLPNYNVISLLPNFQGIPGLNIDLKKEVYIRENILPIFISERTPNKNREDLWELLEEVNLVYLNQLEWLIRTNTQYSGDNLYVTELKEKNKKYDSFDLLGNNSTTIIKEILSVISSGVNFEIKNISIDNSNRELIFNILHPIYLKSLSYKKEKQLEGINSKKGISNIILENEIFELYFKKKINLEDSLIKLNMKQATFYRKYSKFKKDIKF